MGRELCPYLWYFMCRHELPGLCRSWNAFSNWTMSVWRQPGRWLRQRSAIDPEKARILVRSMIAHEFTFSSFSSSFLRGQSWDDHADSPLVFTGEGCSCLMISEVGEYGRGSPKAVPYATLKGILSYLDISIYLPCFVPRPFQRKLLDLDRRNKSIMSQH